MEKEAATGFPLEEIVEGKARILVPQLSSYLRPDGVYEPAWAPVFYNPKMSFNRDIAVVFARVYGRNAGKELLVVEPLAGTGVRAVRYALEANAYVVANDINRSAVELIERNVARNNVSSRVKVFNLDANELLAGLQRRGITPLIIDIDPFGSPAPFLDTAIQAIKVRGVLAVTATDTAPLSGTHPRALKRKYMVSPGRTAWEKEQAVRILAGYIIRRAAVFEYAARILLAYYADYYVRIYVELVKGARRADKSLETLRYGVYCRHCSYTGYTETPAGYCPFCGLGPVELVGPLYSGPLCDQELVSRMASEALKLEWLQNRVRVVDFLQKYLRECAIKKPYYRVDRIASRLRVNMPKPQLVAAQLEALGYKASRTHFDPRGVKTNAPHNTVLEVVRKLSPSTKTTQ